jgi:hypothetical protein
MADRPEGGDKAAAPAEKSCNWVDQHIWAPASDWWNSKTVRPSIKFTGEPDSITFGPITTCDRTTGQLVTKQDQRTEHHSEASRRYQPPR